MKYWQEKHDMATWRNRLAALVLACATPLAAWAQNAIQAITSTQQGGADVVRIELAQPLTAVPNGFSVQTPPRVAIDLPPLANAIGRPVVEINQGNLRSVAIAQSNERTRLVLNLRQAASYRAELQGKALLLVLEGTPSAPQAAAAGQAVQFAAPQNNEPLPLRDIDFRRGPDGAGRVVVSLASTQVGVDIRQQGQSLVVEFLRSSLPEALRRRLDVTDFGTPVQSVAAFQAGERVRMVVEPRGAWEHSAYQSDNQFVLEVRPLKPGPCVSLFGSTFMGRTSSTNWLSLW